MENDSSFQVVFENGVCRLQGSLVDSTNLDAHRGIFEKSEELSMSELSSVSWLGLQKLYQLVYNLDHKIYFSHIPPHIYRILLLMPSFGKKIGIKSFMVEVFDSFQEKKNVPLSLEELAELGKSQGCFVKMKNGQKVSGSLHHLCRPYFNNFLQPKKNFVSLWCKKNEELCNFFYEYSCFTRVILEMCSLAQDSTSLLIENSLQKICARISNLEQSIKILNPHFLDVKSQFLLSMLPHIHEISKTVVTGINLSSNTFEAAVQTFEAIFASDRMRSGEIFEQMEYFIRFTDQLTPIAKSLEDVGVELGDNILKYGELKSLRNAFDEVLATTINEKIILSIRNKLNIHNTPNPTWEITLKDIHTEFKAIQTELGHCVVALQGFDLVRQILEHRIAEIEIFKHDLTPVKNKKMPWEELKRKILAQVIEKLVTDEEKHTYAFFFPESAIEQDQSKLTPGQSLFF